MAGASAIATANPAPTGSEPFFAFGHERRMHARAYDYWVSLLRGRRMPCIGDLDPARLDDFAGRSVLVDLPASGGAPVIAYLGQELRDEGRVATPRPTIADVPAGTLLAELLRRFSDIVAHQAPVGFEAEFAGRGGARMLHRGILLPFADERGALVSVYGVINWKQVAATQPAADIAAAIGSVMASRPSGPLLCAWGDGPSAAGIAHAQPGLPPQPREQQLATARTWAALAATDTVRGAASVHAALSAAYDYLLAAHEQAPTSRQVINRVFGPDLKRLDRVRYTATLDHARRLGFGAGKVGPWLDRHAGGYVAVAIAERRARRAERWQVDIDAALDWVEAQPPIGQIELAVDDELMLLIGRRIGNGVEVIAPVPADDLFTGAALTRARLAG